MSDDKIVWVTCPECGADQEDMGHNVACDECGYAPMPTGDTPKSRAPEEPQA